MAGLAGMGSSSSEATATGQILFDGSEGSGTSVPGGIEATTAELAGTATSVSTATGNLHLKTQLAGTATSSSQAEGTLAGMRKVPMAGIARSVSTASGSLFLSTAPVTDNITKGLNRMPLEILVDLINATNGCALTTADITFGPPRALVDASRNTSLMISARPSSVYSGTREVTYDRVDMAALPGSRSINFSIRGAASMKDVVPLINEAYQINLQPEDYYDDALPSSEQLAENGNHFTLRAKPGSYIYRNWLMLSANGDKIVIGDYITQQLLNGFVMPDMLETLAGTEILNGFNFPLEGSENLSGVAAVTTS
jgi:hypothetical protein